MRLTTVVPSPFGGGRVRIPPHQPQLIAVTLNNKPVNRRRSYPAADFTSEFANSRHPKPFFEQKK
jgi:hypothetical protein